MTRSVVHQNWTSKLDVLEAAATFPATEQKQPMSRTLTPLPSRHQPRAFLPFSLTSRFTSGLAGGESEVVVRDELPCLDDIGRPTPGRRTSPSSQIRALVPG